MRSLLSRIILAIALAIAACATPVGAQFDSGSDGSDGDLVVSTNMTIPVPEDGVYNYGTITINAGATLSFSPNARRTAVVLLAQGDVLIAGTISVKGGDGLSSTDPLAGAAGSNAVPGPGGHPGGIGAVSEFNGGDGIAESGGGPGGGPASTDPTAGDGSNRGRAGAAGSHFTAGGVPVSNANLPGPVYGDPLLITLTGGSGGAGANFRNNSASTLDGPGGGAGGGGICIASSTAITINGSIDARGGIGFGAVGAGGGGAIGSGGGAGGAIRLMADVITGTGSLLAVGGAGGTGTANGGNGRIRLEAFSNTGTLAGNSSPPPVSGAPTIVSFPAGTVPTIRIASIGGVAIPDPPTGSFTMPDVSVGSGVPNPVAIVVQTTNIPNGAAVILRITLENGAILTESGTVTDGTATVNATIPAGIGHIYATADFSP